MVRAKVDEVGSKETIGVQCLQQMLNTLGGSEQPRLRARPGLHMDTPKTVKNNRNLILEAREDHDPMRELKWRKGGDWGSGDGE